MSGISLPPKGNDAKVLGAYFSPLKVEALATPDMFVKVAEGAFWTADNEHQEFIGGTSPQISAPGANAKWVLLTVTSTGILNLVNGDASSNPELPGVVLYKDELPLAAIFVGDTTTAITNDMIYDVRPTWQIPQTVAQSELDNFATISFVNNGLATKAEIDGTGAANFTLNVGGSSINDSGIYVDRFAGPDVAIRFNELATSGSPSTVTPQWEFTNDGSTWNVIGIPGNIETFLGTKADKTGAPATTGNLAALDVTGNLVDSLIIVNDAASNLTTIWTSQQIDAAKPDKVAPTLNGNLAGLSTPDGDLVDSGLILNDLGTLVSEIWSAQKIDSVKASKITPAATNNLASLSISGQLQDAGALINDAASSATTIMWTSAKIDFDKADKIIPALTNNVALLDATGNLADSGIIVNDAGTGTDHFWTADKIDTTKMDKVGGATVGNFTEFGVGGIVQDNGNSPSTFATAVHTHIATDVTDLIAVVDTRIESAPLGDLVNVLVAGASANDILQFVGGNWTNQTIFTAFGTDFVRSSGSIAESITGVKTFNDDIAFNSGVLVVGDLTVQGTTTTVESVNLEITDKNILLNKGYTGPTSGSTGAGISVNRNETTGSPTSFDLATLIWDDSIEKWKGGLESSEDIVALEGVTVAQPFWETIQAPAQPGSPILPQLIYALGFGVPLPAAGTIGLQVFVNGVKQIEGGSKSYTVNYSNPAQTVVTFTSVGAAPTIDADVEFYGFGYII